MYTINYANIKKDTEKDLEITKLRNRMNELNKKRIQKELDFVEDDDCLTYFPNVSCRGDC